MTASRSPEVNRFGMTIVGKNPKIHQTAKCEKQIPHPLEKRGFGMTARRSPKDDDPAFADGEHVRNNNGRKGIRKHVNGERRTTC
jgi:hypothetical protein